MDNANFQFGLEKGGSKRGRRCPEAPPQMNEDDDQLAKKSKLICTESMRTACSKEIIHQRFSTCWLISVSALLSKIEEIFQCLDQDTQRYLNVYRNCSNPVERRDCCNLLPKALHDEYLYVLKRDRPFDDEMERTYLSAQNSWTADNGGYEVCLLEAVLRLNKIKYEKEVADANNEIKEGTLHTLHSPIIANPGTTLMIRECSPPAAPKVLKYGKDFKMIIDQLCHTFKDEHSVLGGFVTFAQPDSAHVVPFTVCRGEAILCNYGACDDTYNAAAVNLYNKKILRLCILIRIGTHRQAVCQNERAPDGAHMAKSSFKNAVLCSIQ